MARNPNEKPVRGASSKRTTQQGYIVRSTSRFSPPTDIIETEHGIVVLVELSGMRQEDFRIALTDKQLVISGVRKRPEIEAKAYHQLEIGSGEFRITIPIPWTIEEDNVTASYRNGFLQVDLPRKPAQRVHIVDVNTSGD